MEKKRSVGIAVVGWAEIMIGAVIILFSLGLMLNRESTWGLAILYELPTFFMSIFIIISGILALQLKSLGRKMNIILFLVSGILCLTSNFSAFPSMKVYLIGVSASSINIVPLVLMPLVILSAYISFYPKVKEQFKKETLIT